MATPNITLTATLESLNGGPAGSTADPAKLRITLCGYGPVLPRIAGTAMLAQVGPTDILSSGSPISTLLWGNDQITPSGTYYTIEILDGEDNVVQAGAYQFTGGPAAVDLSNATPILPGQPASLPNLVFKPWTGVVPGTAYTAPGQVILVTYNGIPLQPGLSSPYLSYTVSGGTAITLNFTTQLGDKIYALCIA